MEYLALRDGMLQPVATTGEALVPVGQPFRDRPDPVHRSGVPGGVITARFIPAECTCSWAYMAGKLTLKYFNTSCPMLNDHQPDANAVPA